MLERYVHLPGRLLSFLPLANLTMPASWPRHGPRIPSPGTSETRAGTQWARHPPPSPATHHRGPRARHRRARPRRRLRSRRRSDAVRAAARSSAAPGPQCGPAPGASRFRLSSCSAPRRAWADWLQPTTAATLPTRCTFSIVLSSRSCGKPRPRGPAGRDSGSRPGWAIDSCDSRTRLRAVGPGSVREYPGGPGASGSAEGDRRARESAPPLKALRPSTPVASRNRGPRRDTR